MNRRLFVSDTRQASRGGVAKPTGGKRERSYKEGVEKIRRGKKTPLSEKGEIRRRSESLGPKNVQAKGNRLRALEK